MQRDHRDVIAAIDDCADSVATSWDGDRTMDRGALVGHLEAALEGAGVLEDLPTVLSDAVAATGWDLPAEPVAAPPYVVVTSRGPVLRATVDPGRLVLRFDAFDVTRRPTAYRRRDGVELVVSLE